MRLITQRDLIRKVAKLWDLQYPPVNYYYSDGSKAIISKALNGLNLETASAQAVNQIIGNDSWTDIPKCSECKTRPNDAVLQVGEEPDYESKTAYLCQECARKAGEVALLPGC